MQRVANWPDQIRRERRNTAPLHYVDIPVDAKDYDPIRDGNKGVNVIDAIKKYRKVLAETPAQGEATSFGNKPRSQPLCLAVDPSLLVAHLHKLSAEVIVTRLLLDSSVAAATQPFPTQHFSLSRRFVRGV